MRYLDTNVLLRTLTGGDPRQAEASRRLLARLRDGTEEAMTSELVVAEVMYVLTSRLYRVSVVDAATRCIELLKAPGLLLSDKSTCLQALDLTITYPHLRFEDAYSVAHMDALGIDEILSYDHDFDRVPRITGVEP